MRTIGICEFSGVRITWEDLVLRTSLVGTGFERERVLLCPDDLLSIPVHVDTTWACLVCTFGTIEREPTGSHRNVQRRFGRVNIPGLAKRGWRGGLR